MPAFLRWHDLKNDPATRLSSPLLLVKVELAKKRGVRDSYTLRVTDAVAEVNPALRQYLHQLYGITLPERVDLAERDAVAGLHAVLAAEIARTEPGLTLHLRERPRIDLVRHRAQLRLRSYRRRQHGNRAGEFGSRHYAYSYRRTDYQPLGVQIFRTQLCHTGLPVGLYLGDEPATRTPAMTSVDTDLYALDTGADGSPYSWDVDLCAVTLANFNYRTLGLVRDYDELLADGRSSASFDQLFSDSPRPLTPAVDDLAVADRHLVVPADGSQVAAIARARRGDSLVIQGPPGTGKSQTITNMIADFVARGRRVLFVCQKRAALDVVHSRLAGRNLDELCTLIHDSQADKKAFVHGLRDTYESWLTAGNDLESLTVRRTAAVARVDSLLSTVTAFETALGDTVDPRLASGGSAGTSAAAPLLRDVVNRLVELRSQAWGSDLAAEQRRLLPVPAEWWRGREAVDAVAAALPAGTVTFAGSPLSAVAPGLWASPAADAEIPSRAAVTRGAWDEVGAAVDALAGHQPWAVDLHSESVARLHELAGLGLAVGPLAERGRSSVLDPGSPAAQALRDEVSRHESLVAAEQAARRAATGWREPLPEADARSALVVAQGKEGSLFGFLSKDWRNVKALVASRFDSSGRAVRPRVTEVLSALVASYDAAAAVRENAERFRREWGRDDPPALARALSAYAQSADPLIARWRTALATQPGPELALLLNRLGSALRSADQFCTPRTSENSRDAAASEAGLDGSASTQGVEGYADSPDVARYADSPDGAARSATVLLAAEIHARPLSVVREVVRSLASPELAAAIRTLGPAMRRLGEAPATVQMAVRNLAGTPRELEYAVCAAHWERARAAAPVLSELTSARLDDVVAELGAAADELTDLDAAVVVAGVRARFLDELAHSELSASGMTEADRARKKSFSAGRRALEHEFGKVMRYRSIRELSSGDAGSVVALLRPVWLMSPSSVSDTLPLDTGFDVVIYDEASQIPVEEAIPAMHRAPQVIVVGDRMQLPPTQYFQVTSRGPQTADERDEFDDLDADDAEQVGVVLTEDSFLSVSALRLASTMLSWHYRSRSEALISFSNAAFYGGRLATIPDRLPARPADGWLVHSHGPFSQLTEAVLAGSITSVRVLDGVYVRRTNPAEAAWIAGLVRDLLARDTGQSIGIVAFSEAQQGEIERALEALAQADPEFGARYEAELTRTADNTDAGLFVKNLENVQGDERDIVILSICYAPGPEGRMLMNFGPINTAGGEKRLNVIFSRARRHMVVVSSIQPDAITNTYNDGANTLRRFLGYADAVSRGDTAAARAALSPYAAGRSATAARSATAGRSLPALAGADRQAVVDQLAEALHGQGVEVRLDVGESAFRCDLALRRPGENGYRIAVLVDTPARVSSDSTYERLSTHHRALTGAGWTVANVLTSDWLRDPDAVVTRIVETLDEAR